MSTPSFVAQDSSQLTTPRYYTAYDPYVYDVDNRPLSDIQANVIAISTGSGDGARRASILSQLAANAYLNGYHKVPSNGYFYGLQVSNPSANTITIGPGGVLLHDNVNVSISTDVVKPAISIAPQTVTVTPPGTGGQSINYLIQGRFVYLDGTTIPTASLPFLDASNAFFQQSLQMGELKLAAKAGTAAATGSQTTPTADAGYFPLYSVTTTNGSTTPTNITLAASAPSTRSLSINPDIYIPGSGGAGTTTLNGMSIPSFVDGSTTAVVFSVPVNSRDLNPYQPIKLALSLASTAAGGGGGVFNISYLGLHSGDSAAASPVTSSNDTFTLSSTANAITGYTSTNAVVPVTAFAGYSSNVWSITASSLIVQLSRVGADGADTNTGSITLTGLSLFQ